MKACKPDRVAELAERVRIANLRDERRHAGRRGIAYPVSIDSRDLDVLLNAAKKGVGATRDMQVALGALHECMLAREAGPNEPLEPLAQIALWTGMIIGRNCSLPYSDEIKAELDGRAEARRKENLKKASAAKRRQADPVREAAKAEIAAKPNIGQNACARRLVAILGRDQRSVSRLIEPFFEWRTLPGGAREKRPKPEFLRPTPVANRRLAGPSADTPDLPAVLRYRAPP